MRSILFTGIITLLSLCGYSQTIAADTLPVLIALAKLNTSVASKSGNTTKYAQSFFTNGYVVNYPDGSSPNVYLDTRRRILKGYHIFYVCLQPALSNNNQ